MIDNICFDILSTALLLNFIVNEEEIKMETLLMVTRGLLLACVIFYIYFFTRRKDRNVSTKLWIIIMVGLLVGAVGKIIEVNIGISTWSSIQISLLLSLALFGYSVWKLLSELKK